MRKATATAILVAVLCTSSAFAAPNDSSVRNIGPLARIIRIIKKLIPIIPTDDAPSQPGIPIPGQP